jgi:glycosyltransferase involved in cell wall biosynthesis
MPDSHSNVLHVVAGDTSPARLERLRVLYARPELARQRVVQLGSGTIDCAGLGKVEHLSAPFGVGRLATDRLRTMVPAAERTILHIWSAKALSWVMPTAGIGKRYGAAAGRIRDHLLMDVEVPFDFRRLARAISRLRSDAGPAFVCTTHTRRRRLVAAGVPADNCVVIRDSVELTPIDAARRSDVRARLDVSPEHTTVLVLPPVLRETGAFVAAWATMLLAQVRPSVRLVVPEAGPEVDRVARLVESCRHQWMLRLTGGHYGPDELVAAADFAVYLPAGDAALSGVVWAMAAGRPIVASAVPATTELLTDGQNAWLCRPESPKDAARRLLQALESQDQSQRQAELGRSQVFQICDRRRMIEQYRRAYQNLLADRCIAHGIEDAVLMPCD